MKKKDWAILLLTAVYSLLFYHQHAGLNFLLFTLAVVALTAISDRPVLKNRYWLFGASLTVLSGVFVFMYGSSLALLANCISLLLIASFNSSGKPSVLFSLAHGVYSIGGSVVFVTKHMVKKSRNTERDGKTIFSKVLTILIPVVLSVVFLAIYKSANPLFANFTEKIDLSFISFEWLLFTLAGFLIVYGIMRYHRIKRLDAWENSVPLLITSNGLASSKWDERKAVILLFIVLNTMLFFINILDVNYLYLGAGMPMGITHKEFVHHGVGMLILSIVLAISTILYFFRGNLNFNDPHKAARILVYAWIAQNLMMVVSTAFRNHLYITEALLTYKRIGVYCWLLMAAIGLMITYLKLSKQRSTWYLFKTNAIVAYVLLVVGAGLDWDRVISDHNFTRVKHIASLDKKYLISLSETNLPMLYAIRNDPAFNTDSLYHYEYAQHYLNTAKLDSKLYYYLLHITKEDWRSFSLRKQRVLQGLNELSSNGLMRSFDFSGAYITTLEPAFPFTNIIHLNLENCGVRRLNELSHFKKLQTLNLNKAGLASLDSLPELLSLRSFSLDVNSISTLKYFSRTPNLELLSLSDNRLTHLDDLPDLSHLKHLYLNGNGVTDLGYLAHCPNLESLSLANYKTNIANIAELHALKQLNISTSPSLLPLLKLNAMAGLEMLDLSFNALHNFALLLSAGSGSTTVAKFEKLSTLNLHANDLYTADGLGIYTQLKKLNLSSNKLRNVTALAALKNLDTLSLSNNEISSLSFIGELQHLKDLDIGGNEMISDFTPLKNLTHLTKLDLSGTGFNDLSALKATQLNSLSLTNCKLASFKNINRFKLLKTLYVSNLGGDDVTELLKLSQLKTLYVSRTNYDWFKKLQDNLRSTEVIMVY